MVVKLNKNQKCFSLRLYFHSTSINSSSNHHNYHSTRKFTIKQDTHYNHNKAHPYLYELDKPQTQCACTSKIKQNRKIIINKLISTDISDITVNKNIKNRAELLALAYTQTYGGNAYFAIFILNRSI